jgi:HD-GYP domain-containing protein (c-di-GMP phosphodiesterase class II)
VCCANADSCRVTTAASTVSADRGRQPAELDPAVTELITQARERATRRLGGRALIGAFVFNTVFFACSIALAVVNPGHRSVDWFAVAVLVSTYALSSRVKFEVRTGTALPTEIVLVPMLFLLPLGLVPLFVCLSLLLGRVVLPGRGRLRLDRALLVPMNAMHVLGPAIVLGAAGAFEPQLRDWPVYVAALGAQLAVDFVISGSWDWFTKGVRPTTQLPYMGWAFAIDSALAGVGLLAALASAGHPEATLLLLPLIGLLAMFAREREVRIDHTLELSHAYRGTALLLGDVVEADDAYTGSHSREVVDLVLDVCDLLGLNALDRRDAEFAALLHDVGKIKVPAEIVNKQGPLTDEERAVIDQHTIEGERLLSQVGGILGDVGRVVRSCHENWDGTGYPDGTAGEQIPLAARIVRICDAYSAMTTDRPYRKARPRAEALAELRRCAGKDFDPAVVEALAQTLSL